MHNQKIVDRMFLNGAKLWPGISVQCVEAIDADNSGAFSPENDVTELPYCVSQNSYRSHAWISAKHTA